MGRRPRIKEDVKLIPVPLSEEELKEREAQKATKEVPGPAPAGLTEVEKLTDEDFLNLLTPAVEQHLSEPLEPGEEEFPQIDDFEFATDERRRGNLAVSVQGKLGRMVLFKQAFDLLCKGSGYEAEVKFIRLAITPKFPDRIWIIPARDKSVPGSRGVHVTGNTKLISCKGLLNKLHLDKTAGQFEVTWDKTNKGLVVNLSKPLKPLKPVA